RLCYFFFSSRRRHTRWPRDWSSDVCSSDLSSSSVPYGVIVHGTELLLLDAKRRRSAFKRWTARQLLGGCAVVVANSRWTADLARTLLGALDCPSLAAGVRVVPPGTTPSHFRPDIDPRPVRRKYGLDGGP